MRIRYQWQQFEYSRSKTDLVSVCEILTINILMISFSEYYIVAAKLISKDYV